MLYNGSCVLPGHPVAVLMGGSGTRHHVRAPHIRNRLDQVTLEGMRKFPTPHRWGGTTRQQTETHADAAHYDDVAKARQFIIWERNIAIASMMSIMTTMLITTRSRRSHNIAHVVLRALVATVARMMRARRSVLIVLDGDVCVFLCNNFKLFITLLLKKLYHDYLTIFTYTCVFLWIKNFQFVNFNSNDSKRTISN